MRDKPGCILFERDDGTLFAEDTQGDIIRAFMPNGTPKKVDFHGIVLSWLHSGEYTIISLEDDEQEN